MIVPQQHDNVPGQASTREQDAASMFSDFDLYLFEHSKGYHYRLMLWLE
jgi:hypothetical protein